MLWRVLAWCCVVCVSASVSGCGGLFVDVVVTWICSESVFRAEGRLATQAPERQLRGECQVTAHEGTLARGPKTMTADLVDEIPKE